MKTVILRLPTLNQSYRIRGLTVEQAALIKLAAKHDKMKMVIGLISQGVVKPRMTISDADQFCIDHAPEAAQLAAEIVKLTVEK
jgi:hypothetical protein